jgi:hypothetical protein
VKTEAVRVADLTRHADVMMRAIDEEVVAEYSERLALTPDAWKTWPPIMVVRGEDGTMWVCDGNHRYAAAVMAEIEYLNATIQDGDIETAKLVAASGNRNHGLRRTFEEKRRAVLAVLDSPDAEGWSARKIADWVGVSNTFVSSIVAARAKAKPEPRAQGVNVDTSAPDPDENFDLPDGQTHCEAGPEPEPAPRPIAPAVKDATGRAVPDNLLVVWSTAEAMTAAGKMASQVEDELDRLAGLPGGEGLGQADGAQYRKPLRDLREIVKHQRPHAVCEKCDGAGCKKCGGRGWWTKQVADMAARQRGE